MNEYRFVSHWRVEGTVEEVYDIIEDVPSLTRWWPSVYLGADVLVAGDANGVGKKVNLWTKGWLPYTLRWQLLVNETDRPHGSTIAASGDLTGRGTWSFQQDGPMVKVTYRWQVAADKPLLRYLSFMFKPLFAANHRWAMARGEESLKLELVRRRATNLEDASLVPAPPGPTFPHHQSRSS